MNRISEAILFVSSASRASVPCVAFVMKNQIPLTIVRLDSLEARKAAQKGNPGVKITVVPTLLVTYEDGDLQLFVGTEKIMRWLANVIRPPERSDESERDYPQEVQNKSHPSQRHQKRKKIISPEENPASDSDSNTGVDIEFLQGQSNRPPPPPTHMLSTGAPVNRGMGDIRQKAKQMEAERLASMPDEKDLPRH